MRLLIAALLMHERQDFVESVESRIMIFPKSGTISPRDTDEILTRLHTSYDKPPRAGVQN